MISWGVETSVRILNWGVRTNGGGAKISRKCRNLVKKVHEFKIIRAILDKFLETSEIFFAKIVNGGGGL